MGLKPIVDACPPPVCHATIDHLGHGACSLQAVNPIHLLKDFFLPHISLLDIRANNHSPWIPSKPYLPLSPSIFLLSPLSAARRCPCPLPVAPAVAPLPRACSAAATCPTTALSPPMPAPTPALEKKVGKMLNVFKILVQRFQIPFSTFFLVKC